MLNIIYPGTALRMGANGESVRTLQQCLNSTISAALAIDGAFGPRTEAAVIAFQRRFGLVPDGIVGPITWAELMRQCAQETANQTPPATSTVNATLRIGANGESVRTLQQCLNSTISAALAIDGAFGPRTEAAVIAFQRRFGLVPDGIVGPITWAELMRQCAISPGSTPPPVTPPPTSSSKTVVLDAGHGGSDPGAVFGTRREKDDNLRLALAVRQLLQAQGINVIMTRSNDIFVSLTQRSNISNSNNANLFVSIHRNSSVNNTANGVENYIFTTAGATTAYNAHMALNEIADVGVQNNRGVIRASFSVLRNTNAPAMLLEMGFITNATDNILFDQHLAAYANAIAKGIINSLKPASMQGITFHTVVSGDSLPSIAARYGTSTSTIMADNKLTRSTLMTGQVLKIRV